MSRTGGLDYRLPFRHKIGSRFIRRPSGLRAIGVELGHLERLYKEVDWESFQGPNPEFIHFSGHKIPYAVFKNEPEVTDDPQRLGPALEGCLVKLFDIQRRK